MFQNKESKWRNLATTTGAVAKRPKPSLSIVY